MVFMSLKKQSHLHNQGWDVPCPPFWALGMWRWIVGLHDVFVHHIQYSVGLVLIIGYVLEGCFGIVLEKAFLTLSMMVDNPDVLVCASFEILGDVVV